MDLAILKYGRGFQGMRERGVGVEVWSLER